VNVRIFFLLLSLPNIWIVPHFWRIYYPSLYLILSCTPLTRHEIYLVFSAFSSRLTFLLAPNKLLCFFLTVFRFPPNKMTSSAQTRIWCAPFDSNLTKSILISLIPLSKLQARAYRQEIHRWSWSWDRTGEPEMWFTGEACLKFKDLVRDSRKISHTSVSKKSRFEVNRYLFRK
jgi:hypothetical protein